MSWLKDEYAERQQAEKAASAIDAAKKAELERRRQSAVECLWHGRNISPMVKRLLEELAIEYWELTWWDRLFGAGRALAKPMDERACRQYRWTEGSLEPVFRWTVEYYKGSRRKGEFRVMLITGGPPWRFRVLPGKDLDVGDLATVTADTSEESLKQALRVAFSLGPRDLRPPTQS